MTNPKILAIITFISLIIGGVFLFSLFRTPGGKAALPFFQSSPNPSSAESSISKNNLTVTSTFPKDGTSEVYPGEIEITADFNQVIRADDVQFDLQPKTPFDWKVINPFPSQQLQVKIYGGLAKQAKYQATVKNKQGKIVKQWSFTTSNETAQSSSAQVYLKEQQLIKDYYPLFDYIPYSNSDFDIDYTAHLTLTVRIKNSNIEAVKQEVNDWIKSHGVDPSTHTINYLF